LSKGENIKVGKREMVREGRKDRVEKAESACNEMNEGLDSKVQ
jgi:hypothetical protein